MEVRSAAHPAVEILDLGMGDVKGRRDEPRVGRAIDAMALVADHPAVNKVHWLAGKAPYDGDFLPLLAHRGRRLDEIGPADCLIMHIGKMREIKDIFMQP